VVVYLPSKHKVLCSNLSTTKRKNRMNKQEKVISLNNVLDEVVKLLILLNIDP
jgi:hypothetical protein